LQYPEWIEGLKEISLYPEVRESEVRTGSIKSDVERLVEKRSSYKQKIYILEQAIKELNDPIGCYLFDSVTTGRTFPYYEAKGIGCGRDYWYDRYRRFFYILDKIRE